MSVWLRFELFPCPSCCSPHPLSPPFGYENRLKKQQRAILLSHLDICFCWLLILQDHYKKKMIAIHCIAFERFCVKPGLCVSKDASNVTADCCMLQNVRQQHFCTIFLLLQCIAQPHTAAFSTAFAMQSIARENFSFFKVFIAFAGHVTICQILPLCACPRKLWG